MKKRMVAFIMICLMTWGGTVSPMKAQETTTRATWLWNPYEIVNDEAATLAFIKEKSINEVYIQVDRELSMSVYRQFIAKATSLGVKVYALDGAPSWVSAKGYTSQDSLMNWLTTYQKGSKANQTFSGVHLDVEPYLYPGWSTNQAATIKSYQALLTRAKGQVDKMKLPLEVDMPFWFDEINYKNSYGSGKLAEWVIAKTDGVTIMAYRDSAAAIIDLAQNEMNIAKNYNKKVVIGVETGKSLEGETISFFEEGEGYMNEQLSLVANHYMTTSSYGGVAIHHLSSWKNLQP